MAFDIEIEVVGIPGVLQFLRDLPRKWQIITHDNLVHWGRELTSIAERLSPEDKLRGIDRRRRPASEGFKFQWISEVNIRGNNVELGLQNIDPKAEFILFPTKGGDTITSSGAWPLRYYTPDGHMYTAQQVSRGETKGQPVHEWALKEFDLDNNVRKLADSLVRR